MKDEIEAVSESVDRWLRENPMTLDQARAHEEFFKDPGQWACACVGTVHALRKIKDAPCGCALARLQAERALGRGPTAVVPDEPLPDYDEMPRLERAVRSSMNRTDFLRRSR